MDAEMEDVNRIDADAEMAAETSEEEEQPDDQGDEGWNDWEDNNDVDGEEEPARSIYEPSLVLPSPLAAIQHDADKHGFDLRQYIIQENLEEYDIFRCINWMRARVAAGSSPSPSPTSMLEWRGNDDYLKPVMEDDALLFHDYETIVETWRSMSLMQGQSLGEEGPSNDAQEGRQVSLAELQGQVISLRDENEGLKEALAVLVASCMPDELKSEAFVQQGDGSGPDPRATTSLSQKMDEAPSATPPPAPALTNAAKSIDSSYFDSYSQFGIHREMISDAARTEAYRKALELNPSLIKGKTVLDVGCGTGILSLFACRAGASHVYSVEGSERMAKFATEVSKRNRFDSNSGGPMIVLNSKVEEIQALPALPHLPPTSSSSDESKADVLVSEWMGYALLFETMLDSVLHARDNLLKPGGAVLPDLAHIIIAGAGPKSTESHFWRDVYGFDMSPIADEVGKSEVGKALVHVVDAADLVTESLKVRTLDLVTMKGEDQDFSAEFSLSCPESHPPSVSWCHSIVIWFDTEFSPRFCQETPVVLSTSVHTQPTHWVQTVLVLDQPVPLLKGEGGLGAPCIKGRLSMVRDKRKHRSLDISLEYKAELNDGSSIQKATLYNMSVRD